ncbi:MAG: helix-turn-helix transcriptional regulator [Micromonosporaceae bacterium]
MLARFSSLVGRTIEQGRLAGALSAARREHGGTVFLVGEAGIGKSRLAVHTAEAAAELGMLVVRGRVSELAPEVPFRPIAEVILGLSRTSDAPRATELIPYRRALGRLVPDWRETPSENGPDEDDSLVVLAEAVLRLTIHAARGRGCLVVLEDIHWADSETLAVVEFLLDNLTGHPVLLLATVRCEPCAAVNLARAATRRLGSGLIELGALSDDDIGQLAADRLDVAVGQVPPVVLTRLSQGCTGNPFLAEEMLNDMIATGALVRSGGRWQTVAEVPIRPPTTVVRSIVLRAERLGEPATLMLRTAAMLGRRFPLDVLQRATGVDDRTLTTHIRAAAAAQLLVPDGEAPDWYSFRHALTAEALLDELRPGARAELARHIADVVEQCHPDRSGAWCQLLAELRLAAGDPAEAGRQLLAAGRRALADGAAISAVSMLERARTLLADGPDVGAFADVMEALLLALLELGHIDEALAHANVLTSAGCSLSPERQAALHCHLGWVAAMAGRVEDGRAQVTAARSLIEDLRDDRHTAAIDVVAAYLALDGGRPNGLALAEELARRAAVVAERVPLPTVACQAWLFLGIAARWRSMDQAGRCFRRMGAIADKHRLPVWRLRAIAFLAVNDALADGRIDRLAQARDEARRVGAVAFTYGLGAKLALMAVLRGEWARAEALVDECWPAGTRLRHDDIVRYAAVARAALGAHRGRREEMEQALADFRRWGGGDSYHLPMIVGLCQAVCALLEEDADGACSLLAQGAEHEASSPVPLHLGGRHGLRVLLRAVRGEVDLARCHRAMDAPPSRVRWNRQFVLLAQAVLLGRAGRSDEASTVAAQARRVAAPFPVARHLGARLAAEAALADGWGEPVVWLREAEEYFHAAGVPAVASACRALLRGAGARVSQRRVGRGRVPEPLRLAGVTAREFDVLELVLDRWGNQQIAQRLHISPRTVEKHVASLIRKTGQPDRLALLRSVAAEQNLSA